VLLPYNHRLLANHKHQHSSVRVAVAQLGPVLGDVDGNRSRALEAIDAAAAQGAALTVLPELCISGYAFADMAEARALAEPIDGPSVRGWLERARQHGIVIVGGLCELDGSGELRNSAVVVDADGIRAVYRKAHLWDREKLFFAPGAAPPPVVETRAGRVGVAICYDAVFPEMLRRLALDGAEVLAVPMNSPVCDPPTEPVLLEIARVMAAANANRVYVAQADRTGEERGIAWTEASVIVDVTGGVIAGPISGAGVLVASCDLARARDKSWGERNDVFGDRRPDIYEAPAGDPAPIVIEEVTT
jgi:5-aminopentanamidase